MLVWIIKYPTYIKGDNKSQSDYFTDHYFD